MLESVRHLPPHDEPAAPVEQAPPGRPHHQRRHQVLEHRAAPRDEGGAELDRRHRSPQPEPVGGRHVAPGDGDEAREPRLGGQEVVAAGIEGAIDHAVADREELRASRRRGSRKSMASRISRANRAISARRSGRAAADGRRPLERRHQLADSLPIDGGGIPGPDGQGPELPPRRRGQGGHVGQGRASVEERGERSGLRREGRHEWASRGGEPAGPRGQGVEIVLLARDGRPHRVRPLGVVAREPGPAGRPGPVGQGLGRGGERRKAVRPVERARRRSRTARRPSAPRPPGAARRDPPRPRRHRPAPPGARAAAPRSPPAPRPPRAAGAVARRPPRRRRSGARPGCRCPRRRCIAARAGAARACRTSCRSVRGTARAAACCRRRARGGRPSRASRSSPGRARPPSTGGRGPGSSATSGAPPPAWDPPGSCPGGARCLPGPRTPRRSASSDAPCSGGSGASRARAAGPAAPPGTRLTHQATAGERSQRATSGPAIAHGTCAAKDQRRGRRPGERECSPHAPVELAQRPARPASPPGPR